MELRMTINKWLRKHFKTIDMAALVLFLANSLVNPIIYSLRMLGLREGLLQLVYRVPDLSRIAPVNLPLRNLLSRATCISISSFCSY